MITEKDYCDYETCIALKELGYNGTPEECSHFGAFYMNGEEIFYDRLYNSELKENECLRVPLYLAQKWLREEKKVIIVIVPYTYNIITETNIWTYEIWLEDNLEREVHDFNTYEEALSEGIKEAVKILKEK